MNKVQEAYAKDPSLLGSELMVGIMEGLLNIPEQMRRNARSHRHSIARGLLIATVMAGEYFGGKLQMTSYNVCQK